MQWERAIPLSLAEELKSFGSEKVHKSVLYNAAADIAEGRNVEEWCEQLLKLINESHQNMRDSVSATQLTYWREIYTDCCILRGIAQFNLARVFEAIATLDHALIITGAYGRLYLVWDIIRKMQSKVPCGSAPNYLVQRDSREVAFRPTCAQNIIPEIPPPSFLSFQFEFSQTPFILRKYASDWPALRDRPWRSAAYLRSISGPGRVVPVEIGRDYRDQSWSQELMDWDRFLSTLNFDDQPASESPKDTFYLAQYDLTRQFPSLLEDIIVPDYVYSSLVSRDFPSYRQPLNDESMLFNTWLGPKDTVSPAHTDPYFNFYVQVVGHKSVWLAPPSVSTYMRPVPLLFDPERPTNSDDLSNTSRVDVFADLSHLENLPEFMQNVVPVSMNAVLAPGDVLFFPPGWWHAMRSETTSFSFSIWF
ncbi:hypothetical protein CPB84DRAFT_1785368 [Gymnopilus junonius]|uniref:JmjC domain-containing protein n=1 Tax=Gymnopilus junonius TaxID=109634 RepID=A0A9P5NK14_GYMJU|nr:hypothetical protein CPB84DRAFT_1785368 [Gymnopilus junonius]